MKKYVILIIPVLCISLVSAGCSGLFKKSSKAQKEEERFVLIDKKINELQRAISNINASAQSIGRQVEELSDRTTNIGRNYTKIDTSLEELNAKVETNDNSLETSISDTQNTINELKTKLSEIELAKEELQNQINSLQSQKSQPVSPAVEHQEELGEVKGETAEETTEAQRGKATVQGLLDEAQAIYKDGNYDDAISKWEEVLNIDPENLEAKLNIEIAKEKIESASEKEE